MGSDPTILLAEDNEMDAVLMARTLRKLGSTFRLNIVSDGAEVLEYLKGEGVYSERAKYPLPWMILLDLRMPRIDGFEVLQWIRAQLRFCDLPVVVTGDSVSPDWLQRTFKCGASVLLSKKPDWEEFHKDLKGVFEKYLRKGSSNQG